MAGRDHASSSAFKRHTHTAHIYQSTCRCGIGQKLQQLLDKSARARGDTDSCARRAVTSQTDVTGGRRMTVRPCADGVPAKTGLPSTCSGGEYLNGVVEVAAREARVDVDERQVLEAKVAAGGLVRGATIPQVLREIVRGGARPEDAEDDRSCAGTTMTQCGSENCPPACAVSDQTLCSWHGCGGMR